MEKTSYLTPCAAKGGLRAPDRRAVAFTRRMLEELELHPKAKVVEVFDASQSKVSCPSEDGKLKAVVMSPPTYLDWKGEGINSHEKEFMGKKPDRLMAVAQHFGLMKKLLSRGIKVTIVKPANEMLEGVFTRDVVFVIDHQAFQSNLKMEERKMEESRVTGGIVPEKEVVIEGGNVILGKGVAFLGVGDRTTENAVEWLQWKLGSSRQVIPLHLKEGVLHLDCAFCPIEERNGKPGAALVYPGAFEKKEELALINSMYGSVKTVPEAEYSMLGPNVLKLDKTSAIVNPSAVKVAGELGKLGVDVIMHGYGEIIKGGGAYRCTYAAIEREN